MILRKRRKGASAEADGAELRIVYRVGFVRVVKRVPGKHAISGRKIMIHAPLHIVVMARLRKRKREPVVRKIRERIQIQ